MISPTEEFVENARKKTGAERVCTGIGITELTIGGRSGVASIVDEYGRARKEYEWNGVRKMKGEGGFGSEVDSNTV